MPIAALTTPQLSECYAQVAVHLRSPPLVRATDCDTDVLLHRLADPRTSSTGRWFRLAEQSLPADRVRAIACPAELVGTHRFHKTYDTPNEFAQVCTFPSLIQPCRHARALAAKEVATSRRALSTWCAPWRCRIACAEVLGEVRDAFLEAEQISLPTSQLVAELAGPHLAEVARYLATGLTAQQSSELAAP